MSHSRQRMQPGAGDRRASRRSDARFIAACLLPLAACGGAGAARESSAQPAAGRGAGGAEASARSASAKEPAKVEPARADSAVSLDTRDETAPAFQTDFPVRDVAEPWNVFGAREGNKMAYGGPEGLWLKIA